MKEKKCFKCGEIKSLDDFYYHRAMADKHLGKCKECTKRDEKLNRIKNPEKARLKELKRYKNEHRKESIRKHVKEWNLKNPEKYKAHYLLSNAVRDKRIKKATECEICGSVFCIHAHHNDYSKPLEVIWICAKCHAQIQ